MTKKAELLRKLDASLAARPVARQPTPAPAVVAPQPDAPPPAAAASAVVTPTVPAASVALASPEAGARRTQAQQIVRRYLGWSAGAGALPLPLIDVAAVTFIQLKMLREISALYGIAFAETRVRAFVAALTGGLAPSALAGATAGSAAKALPGVGWFVGTATVAAFAGASAYAVGHVFIEHFESGGTYLDFKPETMKAFFAAKFQEGQRAAGEFRKEIGRAFTR